LGKLIFFFSIAVSFQVLAGGCAGPRKLPMIAQERIVERSLEWTPDWVFTPISIQEEIFRFTGEATGEADFALALRHAKAQAVKNITEGIQKMVQKEFNDGIRESGISDALLAEFLTDSLAMIMDNLNIHELEPEKVYYEKVEKTTGRVVEYFFNYYILIEIPRGDYIQARDRALLNIRDKARIENNKKVEDIANELLKKFSQ